jgi:hypothetical protein
MYDISVVVFSPTASKTSTSGLIKPVNRSDASRTRWRIRLQISWLRLSTKLGSFGSTSSTSDTSRVHNPESPPSSGLSVELGVVEGEPKAALSASSSRGVVAAGPPSSSQESRSNNCQPVEMSDKLVGAVLELSSNVSSVRTSTGKSCLASDIRTRSCFSLIVSGHCGSYRSGMHQGRKGCSCSGYFELWRASLR